MTRKNLLSWIQETVKRYGSCRLTWLEAIRTSGAVEVIALMKWCGQLGIDAGMEPWHSTKRRETLYLPPQMCDKPGRLDTGEPYLWPFWKEVQAQVGKLGHLTMFIRQERDRPPFVEVRLDVLAGKAGEARGHKDWVAISTVSLDYLMDPREAQIHGVQRGMGMRREYDRQFLSANPDFPGFTDLGG